ncbi:MAG: hypothetical protein JW837_05490 [Sedimentisphaerales bacterium]|nr:hypothetical protein [Sedimentisphaerales bacterium]
MINLIKSFNLSGFYKQGSKLSILLLVLCCVCSFGYGGETVPKQDSLTLMWKTPALFKTPESVIYDDMRDILYVSNFNVKGGFLQRGDSSFDEFISKVKTKGQIEQIKWITGLNGPTGMGIFEDKLFIVERKCLVEVDIKADRISNRYKIPDSGFVNDVIFDDNGVGYISDNNRNSKVSIYRFINGAVEPWINSNQIHQPNGLCFDNGMIVGYDYKSRYLKGINPSDRSIKNMAYLGFDGTTGGLCDGLKVVNANTYLVSDWNGIVYLADKSGHIKKILDMKDIADNPGSRVNSADMEYIPKTKLLIIPTFFDNRLVAYKL